MGKIKLLDENLIKKIAAGEVIERPASVLKELVENSIDAGSGEIEIEFKNGGKDFIIVRDDGCGMDEEDSILCFENHATSKINNLMDLFKIKTLGFRGEALSSIASVSKVTLITSTDGKSGSKVLVEGGKIISSQPYFHKKGTTIIVKDLFYNLPARKKFLRSDGVEKKYLIRTFTNLCLPFYFISFRLFEEKNIIYDLKNKTSLKERVLEFFGEDLKNSIEFLIREKDLIKFQLLVFKEKSELSVPKIKQIFLNGRAVFEKNLYSFLKEKYPKRDWLFFVDMPPEEFDVNIHPAKAEVRFKNFYKIISLFEEKIEKKYFYFSNFHFSNLKEGEKIFVQEKLFEEEKKYNIRFIGQVSGTFLLFEEGKNLIIMDPHAAHERVLFEELIGKNSGKQYLLEPLVLNLNYEEMVSYLENKENLKNLSFEIDQGGEKVIRIRSIPLHFNSFQALEFLKNFLNSGKEKELKEKVISAIACRSAIWFSKTLSELEAIQLYESLMKCLQPNFCPHGRPTFIVLNEERLKKMFER